MTKKNREEGDLLQTPENIIDQPMESEITQSYIDYAMSVIIARALPDTRDGFKPVHRRILYAMNEMGLKHNTKYRKSMTVVGEVLGKFHPHGDSSVYEAMVRLAQDFSMRYPLVDGQGNFGSIDGDGAAASRYTEARLTRLAEYMLISIDEDTVDRRPNYDDSREEPIMLPTIFPNHLCNGTMGIAVGMATNMAPHNLTEVINAALLLISNSKKENLDKGDKLTENTLDITKVYSVCTFWNKDNQINEDIISELLADDNIIFAQKRENAYIFVASFESFEESKSYIYKEIGGNQFWCSYDPNEAGGEISEINQIYKYIYNTEYHGKHEEILKNTQNINDIKQAKSDNGSDIEHNREFANTSIDDIMEIIKGPDFPTGGIIFDHVNIRNIYAKGKGSILIRGKTHIETDKGIDSIIIDEIPYQVNKSTMVEKIGNLVAEKKIEGISDIVDESANVTIRVNIELKKGTNPQTILTQLYKYTDLQTTFGLNNISLVERGMQPRLLNIKDLLIEFIVFRREVVIRRSRFQLAKATDRLHILEGLKRAIDIIDEVIALIRGSETTDEAKKNLMARFDFSEPQAEYILKLTLGRLVGLEMQKILEEMNEKQELIKYLTEIINNPVRLDEVVCEELTDLRNKFGDERRTEVSDDIGDFSGNFKNLLKLQDQKKEDVICLIDNNHHIKILYQSRILNVPEDIIHLVNTNNQDKLIVITDIGELVIQRLKDLGSRNIKQNGLDPVKQRSLKGNVILCETMEDDYESLCLLTTNNSIKKIDKELLLKFKKFPTLIMNLDNNEKIISIVPAASGQKLGIISKLGNLVVFDESQLRTMGKTSGGIKGIELSQNDEVAAMFIYNDEPFVMIYSDRAAKLINVDDIKFHRRGHKGQLVVELHKNEKILGAQAISEGNIRVKLSNEEIKTIHNDNMKLDDLDTPLEAITNLAINMVYIPWEEKVAAKKAKSANIESDQNTSLFEENNK